MHHLDPLCVRLSAVTAPEREALRAILEHADVIFTPDGPVLVAPLSDGQLRALELFEADFEDLEAEEDCGTGEDDAWYLGAA